MSRDSYTAGMNFLLSLIAPDDVRAVRRRIGLGRPMPNTGLGTVLELRWLKPPPSVLLWMLERDDPETNSVVYHLGAVPEATRRDIHRGVPFGTAPGPLPVRLECSWPDCPRGEPEVPESPLGLVGGLRAARTMRQARRAARAVGHRDWPEVAAADQAEPLPGYARWALSVRFDCPPELRARFGTHPKFTHRLRRAGIVSGTGQYAERWTPAWSVLAVLYLGTGLFPERTREVTDLLGPLVRRELGGNPEAWDVLAGWLPRFTGTVPELLRACGAAVRGEACPAGR